MSGINLLPWREALREQRKREFLGALIAVAVIAGLMLLSISHFLNGAIDIQNQRNLYLNEQLVILERRLEAVRELRRQKQALTKRMTVICDLQGNRPLIVHLFDELVRNLPEGVYYNNINRSGDSIRLQGVAASNSLISELMRRLNASGWFAGPGLQQVTADSEMMHAEAGHSHFQLQMAITRPAPGQD